MELGAAAWTTSSCRCRRRWCRRLLRHHPHPPAPAAEQCPSAASHSKHAPNRCCHSPTHGSEYERLLGRLATAGRSLTATGTGGVGVPQRCEETERILTYATNPGPPPVTGGRHGPRGDGVHTRSCHDCRWHKHRHGHCTGLQPLHSCMHCDPRYRRKPDANRGRRLPARSTTTQLTDASGRRNPEGYEVITGGTGTRTSEFRPA
jgi:hypothetical protein